MDNIIKNEDGTVTIETQIPEQVIPPRVDVQIVDPKELQKKIDIYNNNIQEIENTRKETNDGWDKQILDIKAQIAEVQPQLDKILAKVPDALDIKPVVDPISLSPIEEII